jgi:hypothetical protein
MVFGDISGPVGVLLSGNMTDRSVKSQHKILIVLFNIAN